MTNKLAACQMYFPIKTDCLMVRVMPLLSLSQRVGYALSDFLDNCISYNLGE